MNRLLKKKIESQKGVMDLFAEQDSKKNPFEVPIPVEKEYSDTEKLFKEKELLGFFVSGHPLEHYCEQIKTLDASGLEVIDREKDGVYKVVFIIESLVVRISNRTNKKWALMTMGDGSQTFEVPIWPDLYEKASHILEENKVVAAVLQAQKNQELLKIQCKWIHPIEEVNKQVCSDFKKAFRRADSWIKKEKETQKSGLVSGNKNEEDKPLVLVCSIRDLGLEEILRWKKIFMQHPGSSQVMIYFQREDHSIATLELGIKLKVQTNDSLMEKLKETVLTLNQDSAKILT